MIQAKAMIMTRIGGPEVLVEQPVDIQWPRGATDVLVRIRAAGVNPADTFFRALGTYIETSEPVVLGHEAAGVIEAVGSDVTDFGVGDRVCFCHGGIGGEPGTYSQFSVVPQPLLVGIPDSVSFEQAAVFPLVAITAWEALVERAALKAGESVLVHAGAGGSGQMAIQVARLQGARVATTVSTPLKAALAARLGAERTILYNSEPFVEAALEWTQGRGVDVAFDNVGPETLVRTFSAMAPYGRVVTLMGTPADDSAQTAYNRNLSIHNVMMLTPMWLNLERALHRQASIVRSLIAHLATGRLVVTIEHRFPLANAADAHRVLEAGGSSGKIVLEVTA